MRSPEACFDIPSRGTFPACYNLEAFQVDPPLPSFHPTSSYSVPKSYVDKKERCTHIHRLGMLISIYPVQLEEGNFISNNLPSGMLSIASVAQHDRLALPWHLVTLSHMPGRDLGAHKHHHMHMSLIPVALSLPSPPCSRTKTGDREVG